MDSRSIGVVKLLRYLLLLPLVPAFAITTVTSESIGFTLHQTLHLFSVVMALFLASLATLAYLRDRRRRFLFLSGAFFIFTANESITFLANFISTFELIVPVINDPLGHALNLAMLTLFAGGLFVGDRVRANGFKRV